MLWTREELKSNAKFILKRTYWMSFVACLILSILGGGGGVSVSNTLTSRSGENTNLDSYSYSYYMEKLYPILMTVLFVLLLISIIGIIFSVFVSCPITVGGKRFFMTCREEDPNLSELFFSFRNGRYLHIVKTMFLVELYTSLWSLLFVIPGIIKRYEYFFVPYILSENPQIDTKRAFALSKEMSDGRKWDMFVLDLSFFGWYLLGVICCGIGVLFVNPYYQATLAELYTASRAYILQSGRAASWELPGYRDGTAFY